MFLNCYKKTEKGIQKSPESLSFKGFSKFIYEERFGTDRMLSRVSLKKI